MAQKELQVSRPERLVDQGDGSGEAKEEINEKSLHHGILSQNSNKYNYYIKKPEGFPRFHPGFGTAGRGRIQLSRIS
jgi:hypothetical protein